MPGSEVEVTYACADASAGSKFRLAAEQRGAPASSALEGVVQRTQGKFVTKKLDGKLTVRPQTDHISFGLADNDKSASLKLRKITLIRAGN